MVEAFLLYWAFFIPGISLPSGSATYIPFEATKEISRVFFYDLPVIFLILYLLWRDSDGAIKNRFRINRYTFLWSLFNLSVIVASAVLISLLSQFMLPAYRPPLIEAPHTMTAWLIMVIGSFATAYLEEFYFRLYLLYRFDSAGIRPLMANLLSVFLFTLCHSYEGPLGALNAAIAGLFFTLFYRKTKNIHCPAWSHGLYNILAFAVGF